VRVCLPSLVPILNSASRIKQCYNSNCGAHHPNGNFKVKGEHYGISGTTVSWGIGSGYLGRAVSSIDKIKAALF